MQIRVTEQPCQDFTRTTVTDTTHGVVDVLSSPLPAGLCVLRRGLIDIADRWLPKNGQDRRGDQFKPVDGHGRLTIGDQAPRTAIAQVAISLMGNLVTSFDDLGKPGLYLL